MLWNGIVFVTFVSLVSVARCETERKMIRKLVGKTAIFTCPYEKEYRDSPKYLQKREHDASVTLVRSDGRRAWTRDGRYVLNDIKNSGRSHNCNTNAIKNSTLCTLGSWSAGVHKCRCGSNCGAAGHSHSHIVWMRKRRHTPPVAQGPSRQLDQLGEMLKRRLLTMKTIHKNPTACR
ncbi:uncharacterized protein LOC143099193 [Alosa pseudoharengus]|uniref:uncharacterized protein LOC143099193 n=1 Tax=Alosa pseudoharengus TaxID=34774 RepID=UPI003F894D8F